MQILDTSKNHKDGHIAYSEMAVSLKDAASKTLETASVPYRVAGRNVNVTLVGDNVKARAKSIFSEKIDELYERVSYMEHGPQCLVFIDEGKKYSNKVRSVYHFDDRLAVGPNAFDKSPDWSLTNPVRRRVLEYKEPGVASHRIVLSNIDISKGVMSMGDLHKDIIRATTDDELVTWGNVVAVPDKGGDKGVLILGPSGVGKTEGLNVMVNHGAYLVDDDAALIGKNGLVGGVGYKCEYSLKEYVRGERRDPERSPKFKNFFLDQNVPYKHISIKNLQELGVIKKVDKMQEVFQPAPVPIDTILFYLPWEPGYHNMVLKEENPTEAFIIDAMSGLEGLPRKEYHRDSRERNVEYVSRWFKAESKVNPSDRKTLANMKDTYTQDELYKILGTHWILRHAEEYCSGDVRGTNDWMVKYTKDLLRNAENVYMIGKMTPPDQNIRLSKYLVEEIIPGRK